MLAIYYGASHEEQHLYLFLDLFLLLTKFTNKLRTVFLLLSLSLHFEILNPQRLDTAYFICMRIVVSCFILQKRETIAFVIVALLYIFIRLSIYNQPTIYIAIITIVATNIYSCLRNTQLQRQSIQMDLHKLYAFFQDALPISLCIIQQDGTNLAIKFQTQQFTIEYGQLNPETIPQITSKSNLETLAAFLKRPKPSENTPYECLHRRKLEQCTLEIADKNLQEAFPIDIEIIEIIWEYKPANLIIFESQNQKSLKSQVQSLQIQDIYKDELLASVSHDFKTPINGIMSIVQYLEEISTDENQLYHLRIIIKNASLLLFMISDILDFARIQKNQLRLCNSTFYVQNIVSVSSSLNQEIIELLSLQSHQKGIQISSKFNLKSGLMYSDPNRIKQILLNLLSNSLKFTERGQIQVLVDQENFDDRQVANKVITITVTDTGVGIPENVKPKLFKMFGTFDFKNGMNRNGIGLGLHFCKKLVCLLGPTDEIKLESTVGLGSKFSFQIYLNNEQKNSPPICQNGGSSSEYEYVSVQGPNFQKNRPNYIMSSQILIFNKPLDQLKQNLKQMNKKTFTSLELPARQPVLPMSALEFHHQKRTNSRLIKTKNPTDLLIMEDPENSKRHNINKLINNESTFGSQLKEARKLSNGSIICNSPPQNQYELPEEQMNKLFPTDVDILVVDDSAVNVFAFKLILRKYQQIHIDEAFNGEQALLKIQQKMRQKENYSFIFMDLTMPIMNGYIAVETLRYMESQQKLRKNNLIALTGYDDSKEKERCRQCGFDAFMTKPIKLSDIIQVVQEIKNKS